MADKIGIQFGVEGEKELKQSLSDINAGLKVNRSELELVSAQYEKNADSMEALTARGDALQKMIASQEDKVRVLSEGLQHSASLYGESSRRTMQLQADYNKARAELAKFNQMLDENTAAMDGASNAAGQAGDGAERYGDAARRAGEASQGSKSGIDAMTVALGNLVARGIEKAVSGLIGLAERTRDLRSDLSKLEQNAKSAGVGLETTNEAMRSLNLVTGETDSNVEAVSNLLAAGFDDNSMLRAVEALSGAVIRFPDTLKIESLADSLQETIATSEATGQFAEMLGRVGVDVEKFNTHLERAARTGREQDYVLQTLAKTGLADVAKEYQRANASQKAYADAQYDLTMAMADLGERMEPIITKVMEQITGLLDEHAESVENIMEIIGALAGVLANIIAILGSIPAPVYAVIAGVIMAITAFIKIQKAVETLTGGLSKMTQEFDPARMQMIQMITVAVALAGALALLAFLFLAIKEGIGGAERAMNSFNNIKTPQIDVPRYAKGTRAARGGLALVGEQGPELVAFQGGERVFPAGQTRSILSGGVQAVSETYYITIDAKNVREFNDIVTMAQAARQQRRAR